MNPPKNISVWLDTVPDKKRFPSLKGAATLDVVVIGGGIAGLLAAYSLSQQGLKVGVLEKNHLATGDTSATTGFLTRVPDTSITLVVEKYGTEFAKRIFSATAEHQQFLFSLIRDNAIDCEFRQANSYYGAYAPDDSTIKEEWEHIAPAEPGAQHLGATELKDSPFQDAIQFSGEGMFHSRKFLRALTDILSANGVQIWEESEALDIHCNTGVTVTTADGSVSAKQVIVAMGNPSSLLPELGVLTEPKISYVVAAESQQPLVGADLYWDTLNPYFYYRRISDTAMIVGGCDIDADKTSTQQPFEKLKTFIGEHWGTTFTITHQWSGSLFETVDGLPYAFEHPHYQKKVFVVTGFGGNGLLLGTLCARVATDLAQGKPNSAAELLSLSRTKIQIAAPTRKAASGPVVKKLVVVATTSEFGALNVLKKTVNGVEVALFKTGDQYFALRNACSHAGGSLCDGVVNGTVIECPLHGAQFNVATGAVVGPPAVRAQRTYPVTVSGNTLSIEIETSGTPEPEPTDLGAGRTDWRRLALASLLATAFWCLEFLYQYNVLIPGEVALSLVRSFALAGATLIGVAIFSSSIFKWYPRTAQYWRVRRYLGVSGFVFAAAHAFSVYKFLYNFNLSALYFSYNPFVNPILFGSFALPIFTVMAFTSTDWAVKKLTPKVWKFIHRFVYVAYISMVFHFLLVNPPLLRNAAGYLLISVTTLALTGQLYWFVRTAQKRGIKRLGTLVGIIIILSTIALAYRAFFYAP